MKLYLIPLMFFGVCFVLWKIFDFGYDSADIKNRLASSESLRKAEKQSRQLADMERNRRQIAETKADQAIANSENLAASISIKEDSEQCPELCYLMDWPSQ